MTQKSGQVNSYKGTNTNDQINCFASAIYYESPKNLDVQVSKAIDVINRSKDYMNVCADLATQYHGKWIEISKQKNDQSTVVARNVYWLRFHSTQEPGIAQIERSEGFVDHAYYDVGYWSIGYGTLLHNKEMYGEYRYKTIDEDEGERLLVSEVINIENTLHQIVTVPLTRNQEAALTSFCYNVGTDAFASSNMLKFLNAGDKGKAADEFKKWIYIKGNKSDGLASRRTEEKKLFLKK